MLNHLIKLIWNRKRSNILIMTEVAITFVVLFAVISMTWHFYQAYRQPLGYHVGNTWSVWFHTGAQWNNEKDKDVVKRLVEVLEQQPQIKSADISNDGMLVNSQWTSGEDFENIPLRYEALMVSDNAMKNWQVKLNDGRWFSSQDDGQNYRPVMVNQLFVDTFLDGYDPVDLVIPAAEDSERPPKKIVGVFDSFRQRGDFQAPAPMMMYRYDINAGTQYGVRHIHLTFNEEQNIIYEQELSKILRSVAPNWEFGVSRWQDLRENINNDVLMPMTILAIVVGFLLLMVAMGLFGVLWQNINQRTSEIGLRRAIGASRSAIVWQIVGEMVTLAMFAMVLTSVLLVQVPLLELIDTVTWSNFFVSLASSMALIVLIVILCAVYPGKVAVDKTPALALHYE